MEIAENPEAWVFKGIHQGVLTATICGRCGFAQLYVKNPEELLEVYRRTQAQTIRAADSAEPGDIPDTGQDIG